ncbi:TIGR03086 family metal-binding protein [Gordonia sp. LSe1-13]|uniref:TIGR03086 family metal-binding protein n=1 Tax=Gordonia sesuvii TaxID=3116777 RepID=A0ABU7MI93_9ACTN|nr:TIGR03086 family metal-binding protein [Gordonia sp. LSe1-13]
MVTPVQKEERTDERPRVIDFSEACAELSELVMAVTDDDLAARTPCADYDVAALLDHIEEFATGFTEVAGSRSAAAEPTGARADTRTRDGRQQLAGHLIDLGRAWAHPEPWSGVSDNAGLGLSNATWGRIVLTEVIVHGWDLAAAIDAPFDPPADLVRACHDHVTEFVPTAPVPELWGARVHRDGVGELEATVAVTGRDPRPWPTTTRGRTDQASRVIRAPLPRVFAALVDPDALVEWLPPQGMTGRFDHFDARQGGSYRLTLTYAVVPAAGGKSGADADIVEARFVEIVPDVRVVQAVDFESDDPDFAGTMTMTWSVSEVDGGTRVQITAENVPRGVSAEDHAAGMTSSLAQLDAFLSGPSA